VCDGTWAANLEIAADVDIINPSGVPSDVVIDGGAAASVVLVATAGISSSIEGVTLQNGAGSGDAVASLYPGANGGGVDCSAEGATLALSTVDIIDNAALSGVGGGLASSGCDVFIDDAVISGNEAQYAGGLYVDAGTLTVSESVVTDNVGSQGGGLMVLDYTDAAVLSLDEVEVTGNSSPDDYGGGLGAWETGAGGTTVSCVGSSSTDAGFTDNSAGTGGGGIYLYGGVDLTSTECDFGTSAGGDENSPDDVYTDLDGASYGDLGDDETFTCSEGVCGSLAPSPTLTHSLGFTTYSATQDDSGRGNVFQATADATLRGFSMYMAPSGSCSVDLYVLSNSAASTTGWTVEWSSLGNTVSSTGWVSTGEISVSTVTGMHYGLFAAWQCGSGSLTYYYSTSSADDTISGFAEHSAAGGWTYTYTASLSGSGQSVGWLGTSDSARYYMDVDYAL